MNGFNGSMGKAIQSLCNSRDDKIKIANLKGHDISLKNVSAVIDFSSPSTLDDLLKICLENSLPLVCGTTGFSVMQLKNLEVAANKLPLMLASNMSLGIASLKKNLSRYLSTNTIPAACKIVEIHHTKKKDSPSGTALEISKFINEFADLKINYPINIEAHRIGDHFGMHRVEFHSREGVITSFNHYAASRNIFAIGALEAAVWLQSQEFGLYSFSDFLNKKL